MIVLVNGDPTELAGSLADLITARHGEQAAGIAVALNGAIVPRSLWDSCRPTTGDQVEIVTAVQGG